MRKKWCILLTTVLMFMALLVPSMASAAEVDIGIVSFNVAINGRRVDHRYRKYPLILYNNITYFPMTYNDCAFLGISNNWTPETGNIIEKATPSGFFDDTLDPLCETVTKKQKATVVTTPVTVLGTPLNNAAEEYPVLSYKDVLYFPLTWDWSQKFGWTVELKSNNLEVTTADFTDKGKVAMYDVANGGVPKIFESRYYDTLYDYHVKKSDGSIYSSSKNYTFCKEPIEGFVSLYRFYNDGMYHPYNNINIKKELAGPFLENGWFEAKDIEAVTHEYLKTHSKYETNRMLSALISETNMNSALTSTKVSDVLWNLLPQYTTLYARPAQVINVKNEEVDAYKNVGWMSVEDYVYSFIAERESVGDISGALRVLEAIYYGKSDIMPELEMASLEGSGLNYYGNLSNIYKRLFKQLYPKVNNNIVYAYSYSNDGSIAIMFRGQSVKGLKDFKFTLSYDMYDAAGNYMGTAKENAVCSFWMEEGDQVSPNVHYINPQDHPGLAGVSNVKISNLKITEFEPGYEG